jgi:hypothetical protein
MPDNAIFYQVAYAAAIIVYGGYVISLVVRTRRVRAQERRQLQLGVARDGER